jgi:hypothetical protein
METVIEIKGEKYHLVNKSFTGWLKHIEYFRSRHKSFDDWYSDLSWIANDKFKGIQSLFIFGSRNQKKYYHYFEKGFSPEKAMEDILKLINEN